MTIRPRKKYRGIPNMKAMILPGLCDMRENPIPLVMKEMEVPEPQTGQILVRVSTCGVCHTELDEIEGRTPPLFLPAILGHQIIGRVEKAGPGAGRFSIGERVGIGWIYGACGNCAFCQREDENLCDGFLATGRDAPGGFAEYCVVSDRFAYPIPPLFSDSEAAPLLCAGAIGYRSLRLTGLQDGGNLGLIGFGASAHLVLKMVRHRFPHSRVFVFARSEQEKAFALELGASWSGGIEAQSPTGLQAAIDTTPAWTPVVEGLKNLEKGGRLIINAIRKEEEDKNSLTAIDYSRDLWMEKEIKSVANVSRRDIEDFLTLAAEIPIKAEVEEFDLEEANQALWELKTRKIRGAKVLRMVGT
jgi:propanol-preferring alcohol dehydrogenase